MKLSIYVPTCNRPQYFNRLMRSVDGLPDGVEMIVSVNGAMDGYEIPSWVRVVKQRTNIGGKLNWLLGPMIGVGEYVWMLGDDERITPNGVSEVLRCTETSPGLIINHDGRYDLGVSMGAEFSCYGDYVRAIRDAGRHPAIVANTLCAAMVFRRDRFNMRMALLGSDTLYGQHYGALADSFALPVRVVGEATFLPGSSRQASIWMEPVEVQAEHVLAYPDNIYELVRWVSKRTGVPVDEKLCWVPGDGFDSLEG